MLLLLGCCGHSLPGSCPHAKEAVHTCTTQVTSVRLLPGGVGVEVDVAGQVGAASAELGAAGVVGGSLAVRHAHTGRIAGTGLQQSGACMPCWHGEAAGASWNALQLPNPGVLRMLCNPAVLCMLCNPAVLAVHHHLLSRRSRCRRTLWSARCRWACCSAAAWPSTRRCRVSTARCARAVGQLGRAWRHPGGASLYMCPAAAAGGAPVQRPSGIPRLSASGSPHGSRLHPLLACRVQAGGDQRAGHGHGEPGGHAVQ